MISEYIFETWFWIAAISISIFSILLVVGLIRWILRIDKIVNLLEQIAKNTGSRRIDAVKQIAPKTDSGYCEICNKSYPASKIVKIDSGQMVCSQCYKEMKK